jgi:HNH endonuclease
MIASEAWNKLDALVGMAMNRWTSSRSGRVKFQLERRTDAYQIVMETGREPRKFDRALFMEFWRIWSLGKRVPDDYRDAGPTGGMFKLSFYLLPVAATLDPQAPQRSFKYGDKATWQFAVDAVRDLGGRASLEQITQHLAKRIPDLKLSNVRPDLDLVTVNAFGRANWSQNKKPRKVDGTNTYDVLFSEGGSKGSYVFFNPEVHGLWELAAVPGDDKLRPRRLDEEQTEEELNALNDELDGGNEFDPHDDTDARIKTLGAIARRQGQSSFRNALLKAYGGCCAISGCDVEQTLEAAHIRPYLGARTNVVINGLLLRADLHTLLDLRLVRINPVSMKIEVSSKVKGRHYQAIAGSVLTLPQGSTERPSQASLEWHWNACEPNFADAMAEGGQIEHRAAESIKG